MTKPAIYLDFAAATPVDAVVAKAMMPYFTKLFFNPSATYLAAQSVAKDITNARAKVASILGAKTDEIIFTAGGTEANNVAICGILSQFPDGNLVTTAVEHDSVLVPAQQFNHTTVPVASDGRIIIEDLLKAIDEKTVLISVMYANNEVGTIQPIRQIAKKLQQIRNNRLRVGSKYPLFFHTDAAQAGNYLDLHISQLGVDMMTLNGGKIYGPKQSGALFVRAGTALQPIIWGGGQENNLRSGTENVANIIGFATALGRAQSMRRKESKRLIAIQKQFIDKISQDISGVVINGSVKCRLPNNVHVTFPGQDNERLVMTLDEEGVMCAAASACSASSDEPSHVLKALGLSDEAAQSSLRFSFGRTTTTEDINRVLKILKKLMV